MTRATSSRTYGAAILKGISIASAQYEKMTGGEWLWWAPEYMLTVAVAKFISQYGPVEMEVSTRKSIGDGAPKGSGRHHKLLSGLKRFDIVCFERSGEQLPRAIVEIKHPYHGAIGNLERDVSRIAIALKTADKSRKNPNTGRASIRHGFLAFDTWFKSPRRKDSDSDEKVERWIKTITDLAKEYGVNAKGQKKCIKSFQGENQSEHVYAVVIAMKAKP